MGRVVRFEEGDLLATRSKDSVVYIQIGESRQNLEPEVVRELAETLLELIGDVSVVPATSVAPVAPVGLTDLSSKDVVRQSQNNDIDIKIAELNKQLEDLILESFDLQDGSDEFVQNSIKRNQIQDKIKNLLSQNDSSPQSAWTPPPPPISAFQARFGENPFSNGITGY